MDRPKVVVLNGASVDGRLAVSPGMLLLYGDERWSSLGGQPSFDTFGWLRSHHGAGATLEGSGSFVPEGQAPDPLPPVEGDAQALYQDFLPPSVLQRPGHRGWFTVVDGRGRVRWGTRPWCSGVVQMGPPSCAPWACKDVTAPAGRGACRRAPEMSEERAISSA